MKKFQAEVIADYSWYSQSRNPFMFMARVLLRRYFRFLLVCRILSNFYCGGVKILLFPLLIYYRWMQWHYQIEISIHTEIGKGMILGHYGPRTINGAAVVGEYVQFSPCVLVGGQRGKGCPVIGNHVFLGHGCKIIGNVRIGDYAFISPNSVVVKDVEEGAVVGGVPAKVLNLNGKKNVQLYEPAYLH